MAGEPGLAISQVSITASFSRPSPTPTTSRDMGATGDGANAASDPWLFPVISSRMTRQDNTKAFVAKPPETTPERRSGDQGSLSPRHIRSRRRNGASGSRLPLSGVQGNQVYGLYPTHIHLVLGQKLGAISDAAMPSGLMHIPDPPLTGETRHV